MEQIINTKLIDELFIYDMDLGKIYWKKVPKRLQKRTTTIIEAGNINKTDSYRRIKINYKVYPVHHIIWYIHNGYLPKQIDHINRNRLDNRIENLREVDHIGNARNQNTPKNNSSGYKGVSFHKLRNKWQAKIGINNKQIYLGNFNTKEEAIIKRKEAELLYGFSIAN